MNTRLKDLRLDLGLTQKELAHKIGTTDKNIWAYEKGNVNPPIDVILAYAKYFKVSTDYLLGLEDDFCVRASMSNDELSADEKEFLAKYRAMDFNGKDLIRQIADRLTASRVGKNLK